MCKPSLTFIGLCQSEGFVWQTATRGHRLSGDSMVVSEIRGFGAWGSLLLVNPPMSIDGGHVQGPTVRRRVPERILQR